MFPGFEARDFEAYAPQKWKSNAFTRERLEVKQKLTALGRALSGGLSGADGAPLAVEASAEYPALWNHKQVEAQHVYFFRNEGARKELDQIIDRQKSLASLIDDPSHQKNHIYLSLTIAHQAATIALMLGREADVDRRNLERKCEDFFEREKLMAHLRSLGDEWCVGDQPVASLDDETLRPQLAAFSVSRRFSRDDERLRAAAFEDLARASLRALLPIYQFVAWTRDNDFVSMRETLQKERLAKKQKHLAKNDRVRIVRGMFAGKIGTVQELDAKGTSLKVLVGRMPVKVDAEDVVKA
jgi:transcription antitermination factor NusG